MHRRIIVPVDLAHADRLDKALRTAADLADHYGIPVVYLGVASTLPDAVARTPREHAAKLEAFAAAQAETHGIDASAHPLVSADPQGVLNKLLREAIRTPGADLVEMASHAPSWIDWLIPSHGSSVAEHSAASVVVVR